MSPKTVQIIFLLSLFVFFGCSPKKEAKKTVVPSPVPAVETTDSESTTPLKAMDVNEYYFMASGISPDWTLDISADGIRLRTGEDSYSTPYTTPDRAMDSNIKRYVLRTESTHLNIKIIQEPCESEYDVSRPYSVHVEYKRTLDPEYSVLKGCGAYILDYRLHDIWALESLNGEEVSVMEGLERPYFEIDSRNASFMGSASCNQMRGSLFFEPGLLRFHDILTTRKMCPGGLEAEFLKTLRSTIDYKLEEGRLTLTNPNGAQLVFRKVD
jgi:heat shock protein HslJ/uncharacterized membrane protein